MDDCQNDGVIERVEIPMPFVVFATPSHDHRVSLNYLVSLFETRRLLIERGIGHGFIAIGGDPYLAKVRNKLVTQFLRDYPQATDLFFLDDDVGFPPEKVLQFLLRPEAVLAGIYPKKSDVVDFPVRLLADAESGDLIENSGLLRADSIGAGFLRIKRPVLETLAEHAQKFREMPEGEEYHNIFSMGMGDDGLWWGEDYVFAKKCISLGIDVWIDPDIDFTHSGHKTWRGNMLAELLKRSTRTPEGIKPELLTVEG